PIRATLASQFAGLASLVIAIAAACALGHFSPALILAPVMMLILLFVLAGLALFVAPIGLLVRDLPEIIRVFIMMLLVISPIAYFPDAVPAALTMLVYANPLSYFIIGLQHILVFGQAPSLFGMCVAVLIAMALYTLGFLFLS